MKVSIAYADDDNNLWQTLDVSDDATVEDVIQVSGLLQQIDVDIATHKVGIFGKFVKLNQAVKEGDRVEIYNPITRVLDEDDDDDDD